MRMLAGYWKRSAASVTGFARKYRYDPFFRTELNVVALQVIFTLLVIGILSYGFTQLYADVSKQLLADIAGGLNGSATTTSETIAKNITAIKTRDLWIFSITIALVTALFGYLITRLALAPTRNALEAQKQFIGNIAHELRTPLSIIKTNTEVRLLDEDVPKATRELYNDNLEELDRISDIINNLLSLNVLVKPEKIPFGNVDLGAVADRVVGNLGHLIERKQLKVTLHKADYRTVWGNQTALDQIVMNVVRNAANYTPEKGAISIFIEPDYHGHTNFLVEDTGIGINERDLTHIFEPFYRADQSRTRAGGGSGLGLAIVNELVKLHRGLISIRSAKGRGTSVSILLPSGKDEQKEPEKLQSGGLSEVGMDYSTGFPSPQERDSS